MKTVSKGNRSANNVGGEKEVIDLTHFIKELRRLAEVKTAIQAVGTEGIEVLIQDQVITKEEIQMLSIFTKSSGGSTHSVSSECRG
ncbi:hypothetical protein [Jeotgalibacillus proteolyticus]|uniref:Uncharacterized protein n=1 Tax=Jeotgalibacillus proteolyticus TaxID=2082395 RepID=A0A2S5GB82_9BACL|nr:hypothetical protein [Jeotgalibacillus proteolyticus]PPA70181.1 hypothetical protein C4B60_11380 [Jeotgalibacillus proteolyticus]